jgi:hypothetical protein
MRSSGMGRRRSRNSGEVLAGEGRGRGGAGPRGHIRPICGRSWGQALPAKGAPRRGCVLATADGSAGEVAAWPGNARLGELPGTSGEAPRWLGGWEFRRQGSSAQDANGEAAAAQWPAASREEWISGSIYRQASWKEVRASPVIDTFTICGTAWRRARTEYGGNTVGGSTTWSAWVGSLGPWSCGAWRRGTRRRRRCGAEGPVVTAVHRCPCPVGRPPD